MLPRLHCRHAGAVRRSSRPGETTGDGLTYTLIRSLTSGKLALQQILAFAIAFGIAEMFYKFHSFVLETGAFLATWCVLDFVFGLVFARSVSRESRSHKTRRYTPRPLVDAYSVLFARRSTSSVTMMRDTSCQAVVEIVPAQADILGAEDADVGADVDHVVVVAVDHDRVDRYRRQRTHPGAAAVDPMRAAVGRAHRARARAAAEQDIDQFHVAAAHRDAGDVVRARPVLRRVRLDPLVGRLLGAVEVAGAGGGVAASAVGRRERDARDIVLRELPRASARASCCPGRGCERSSSGGRPRCRLRP